MNELQRINEVFINVFNQNSLERLVKYTFNKNLSAITQAQDFATVVFNLTQWAIHHGRIQELLKAAKEELPKNEDVQALTYASANRIIPQNSSENILMQSQDSISYAILLIRQLEADFKTFKNIIVGEDWASGVRSISYENQRKIDEMMRRMDEFNRVITDIQKEVVSLKMAVSRMENTPPEILSSRQNKLVFGTFFILLLLSVVLVSLGAVGWM